MKIKQYKLDLIKKAKEGIVGGLVFFLFFLYLIISIRISFGIVVFMGVFSFILFIMIIFVKLHFLPTISLLWKMKVVNLLEILYFYNSLLFLLLISYIWGYGENYTTLIAIFIVTIIFSIPFFIRSYKQTCNRLIKIKEGLQFPGFDPSRWICTEIITYQSLDDYFHPSKSIWKALSSFIIGIPGLGLFISRILTKTAGFQVTINFVIWLFFLAIAESIPKLASEIAIFITIRKWEKMKGRPIRLEEE